MAHTRKADLSSVTRKITDHDGEGRFRGAYAEREETSEESYLRTSQLAQDDDAPNLAQNRAGPQRRNTSTRHFRLRHPGLEDD